jgi:ADP-ribosylglycohydrolase
MLGAIAGDIIGSFYEHHPTKSVEFPLFHEHCRFTDDSVMTVAVAHAILENRNYAISMKDFGRSFTQSPGRNKGGPGDRVGDLSCTNRRKQANHPQRINGTIRLRSEPKYRTDQTVL